MIKSFGFEQEFFFRQTGATGPFGGGIVQLPKDLRHLADQCGYLVEARSEAHAKPSHALHLLNAAVCDLATAVKKYGLELVNAHTFELPREFLRICLRTYGKGPCRAYFMGGNVYRNNKPRSGMHVHFGTMRTIEVRNDYKVVVAEMVNMPRIIALMDKAFKEEIKAANRKPGEYEMKAHGFEYRSLPSTVHMAKVVQVLGEIQADLSS